LKKIFTINRPKSVCGRLEGPAASDTFPLVEFKPAIESGVRAARVEALKRAIARGEVDTPENLEFAMNRLVRRLLNPADR